MLVSPQGLGKTMLARNIAQKAVLAGHSVLGAVRGRWHSYQDIKVMPTYHPAYLLRTPSAKRTVWEDLQLVMAELGKTPP